MSERRPHPTLSDVALALATRHVDPITSVELTLNAKGDVQIHVDVNHADPTTAARQASELFDVLRAKYPREAAPTGIEGYQAEVRKLQDERKVAAIQRNRAKKGEA